MRASTGTLLVDGMPVKIRNPHDAIRAGIGFVTEDRKAQGLVLGMSVWENFSLTHLRRYSPFQFVQHARERESCLEYVRMFGIKTPGVEQKVVNLSGGNQQKIVIAKWVARQPKVLIVDEPTRGIDIGAKAEVLAVSDRILTVREGHISGELTRAQASQEKVMALATA